MEPSRRPDVAAPRPPLSEREATILQAVVRRYVGTAVPVASRVLAEEGVLELSSASIRHVMNTLEALGYLGHPHTSAGRVPTDLGYRAYVDELMERRALPAHHRARLEAELAAARGDVEATLRETSRLLGQLTSLLGVALSPRLATGVLEQIEAVPLTSDRLMFVVAVRGGLVKTIVVELEAAASLPREALEAVVAALNERLAGLTLEEIRRTARERIRDLGETDRTGVVRLVLHRAETLFAELPTARQAERGGAARLAAQPEFQEPEELQSVLELLEDDDVVLQLLDDDDSPPARAVVLIGHEVGSERLGGRYSVVRATYRLGDTIGSLGVIGPKRMDYARAVALVEGLAAVLSGTPPTR